MNRNFAAAMGRALDHVRASHPHEATRLIQAALARGPLEDGGKTGPASSSRVRQPPTLIDPDAEDAEIVNLGTRTSAQPRARQMAAGHRRASGAGDRVDACAT